MLAAVWKTSSRCALWQTVAVRQADVGRYIEGDRRFVMQDSFDSLDQNIVLLFAAASGIGWMTSQCSTILPFSDL